MIKAQVTVTLDVEFDGEHERQILEAARRARSAFSSDRRAIEDAIEDASSMWWQNLDEGHVSVDLIEGGDL